MKKNIQLKSILLTSILLLLLTASLLAQDHADLIKTRLTSEQKNRGWQPSDVSEWAITDQHTDKTTNLTYAYVQQRYQNIPVYNAISVFLIKEGQIRYFREGLTTNIGDKATAVKPKIDAEKAISYALDHLNKAAPAGLRLKSSDQSANRYQFDAPELTKSPVKVELVYRPVGDAVMLAWDVSLELKDENHWWNIRIDAITGEFIDKNDFILECNFDLPGSADHHNCNHALSSPTPSPFSPPPPSVAAYNVFQFPVESPNFGNRTLISDPADPIASPFGWHDVNGVSGAEYTITRGNNVYAYEDANNDGLPGYSPDGGAGLQFDFPFFADTVPLINQDASITNLFYANNRIHDMLHHAGFTEAAGNFQKNNYGNGGAANDAVNAEAFDGAGINNANFLTPPDGSSGRMQMYLWNGNYQYCVSLDIASSGFNGALSTIRAAFSPLDDTVTAEVILIDDNIVPNTDGCSPILNNISGKIALIDRGICTYNSKAQAAIAAGAVGVIIVNNVPGNPMTMTGTPNLSIPVVSVSLSDGNLLKAQLIAGTVTATITTCTPLYSRDGSFENGIIVHEYGHGVSNRLTGGPSQAGCLQNAEQGGEGWSDWLALIATIEPGDNGVMPRGIGTYALGQSPSGGGIRRFPYSTDMAINPQTYADVAGSTTVHQRGEIWCDAIWDMTWFLIDDHGFNPDPANTTAGNNIALRLVLEGMKMQPCSPGYLDARDAILLADAILYDNAHRCRIWEAFSRRGMGIDANQGLSTSSVDQTAGFQMPVFCSAPTLSPVAAFAASSSAISCGGTVDFSDQSANAFEWHWNFGDSATSDLQNPSHQYTTPGSYIVKLIATNPLGSDSTTQTITVNSAFTATVTATPEILTCGTPVALNAPASGSTNLQYQATPIPFAPLSETGTNLSLLDDQVSGALPIGFTFNFYGQDYTNFYVCSNGFITFSPGTSAQPPYGNFIPSAYHQQNLIAVAFNDLNPQISGSVIKYFATGVAPNRKLVVSFNTFHFDAPTMPFIAQAILSEGSNDIEIHTTVISDVSLKNIGAVTSQGIENISGTSGTAVPGRNQTHFSASNEAHKFTSYMPYTYTWLPGSLNGAAQTITPISSGSYTVTIGDGTGCLETFTTPLITVSPATATISGDTIICGGAPSVLDAGPGLTWLWSNGATTRTISVYSSGTYSVTVTDANGCIAASAPVNTILYAGVAEKINGSASNAFTNGANYTNPVAVDNALNTVLFIHRNNASLFGGNSGHLRYDISTDGGSTWTNDLGVLNPIQTFPARYPQVAIFNPAGNTDPDNGYLSFLAPTIGTTFNGLVNGVRKLDGTGNTEHYTPPVTGQVPIPHSMVKGAPGIFWAVDFYRTGTSIAGLLIFKGVWNGSSDVIWSVHDTITMAFNTSYDGLPRAADVQIAFDPTGQTGWISILTHLTGNPAARSYYPVFYKTTDGGDTWSGPLTVDLFDYPCITGNISPGNVPTTNFDSDLTVDAYGEPHLLTTICNGNNAYAVFYGLWHHVFDITCNAGAWNVIDIAGVKAGRGIYGTLENTLTMDMTPMVSRSQDGKKVFFAWTDNKNYATGAENLSPNLHSKAYDVSTKKWTAVKDYSVCSPSSAGKIYFPKMATEVLEPSAGNYSLAAVRSEMTSNDPNLTANFHYLDGLTWSDEDFNFVQPAISVAINQGSGISFCPGETAELSITGTYDEVRWSNGSTGLSTNIDTSGIYIVGVRNGCVTGSDTITAILLPAPSPAISGNTAFCNGASTTLDAGLYDNYVWSNGATIQSIIVSDANTYSVTVTHANGCTSSSSVTTIVYPEFVKGSIADDQFICTGTTAEELSGIAPSGGNGPYSYQWQSVTNNPFDTPPVGFTNISGATSLNFQPGVLTQTTYYRQVQTSASGCGSKITDTLTITVEQTPVNGVLTKIPDVASVCYGADLSATFTTGNGGNGTDVVQYRTKTDDTWSAFLPYDQNHSIITNTIDSAQIIIYRTADYCSSSTPDTVSWQVTSPSIGGTATGGTLVCSGTNSTVLTLTGHNGTVQRWESSIDNEHWTNIDDSTGTTFTAINVSQDTWYRALIQSGTCDDVHSVETQITVNSDLQISGFAKYENNPKTPLNGLKVVLNKLESNAWVKVDSIETNALGFYAFDSLSSATYGLVIKSAHPSGHWQTWGGVNNTDYLLVSKHVAGTLFLPVNPPVVKISASVKAPHPLINTADANAIRQAAKYPTTGWSYLDIPKWVFSGLDPSVKIDTMQLNCANLTRDIRGLCAGDVNGTYIPANGVKTLHVETLHVETLHATSLRLVNRGNLPITHEITFPVRAERDMELGALTLMLDYDHARVEISGVEMNQNGGVEPWFETRDGVLYIGWMSLNPINVATGQTVLMIHARVNNAVVETGLKPVSTDASTIRFNLNANPLSELADGDGNVIDDAKLTIPDASANGEMVKWRDGETGTLSVYPNPAKDLLNVEFVVGDVLAMQNFATLQLVTMHGITVSEKTIADVKSGLNKTTMDLSNLPNGAYMLFMEAGGVKSVVKVVVNR